MSFLEKIALWKVQVGEQRTTKFAGVLTILVPCAVLAYTIWYIITILNSSPTINTDIGSTEGKSYPLKLVCTADQCIYRMIYGGADSFDSVCATYTSSYALVSKSGSFDVTPCYTGDPLDGIHIYYRKGTCKDYDPVCFGASYATSIRKDGKIQSTTRQLSHGTYYLTATTITGAPEGSIPITFASQYIAGTINATGNAPSSTFGCNSNPNCTSQKMFFIHVRLSNLLITQEYVDAFNLNDLASVIGGFASLVMTVLGGVASVQFWYLGWSDGARPKEAEYATNGPAVSVNK